MPRMQEVKPGTYVAHLCSGREATFHSVTERNPEEYVRTLPVDVFAFYYFDVEGDGITYDDVEHNHTNRSKQYFVDADLIEYKTAKDMPEVTAFTLERMRALNTPAMCYDRGQRIRFFNPDWQAIVSR